MIDAGTGSTVRVLQKKNPRDRHIIFWWAFGHADPAAAGWLGGLALSKAFFNLRPLGVPYTSKQACKKKRGLSWEQLQEG